MDNSNHDSLENRAEKHAKVMFELKTPTKSKASDLMSVFGDEAGPLSEPRLDALTTPKKRTRGRSYTPKKLVKKGNSSPLVKKGNSQEIDMGRDAEISTSLSDHSETEEVELDTTLNRKAKNVNLSKRNVKSIIHHLLTNEHVIKLYKDVLGAQSADNGQESPVKANSMGALDSFPKMTRSKVKDFMEKSNIPPSPCKKSNAGPSILEVDFAEEEDDDEYSPEKDETNETDDDESVISSYLSEFGSPCPVTPSTPVPRICAEKPALSMSPSVVNSPLSTASNRLRIDLSECEGLSEAEDEGTIALRTRSKRSLMDTSLMDIEQAFIAPDITPDMYDTNYQDKDWTDFLNSLYKTNADESTVDDELNDPEFNYIAEAEEEAFDDEDFRFDKPTKVSKKELNSLIEELHSLFEDEILPLQVVAEASSSQDPISQMVSYNTNKLMTPANRSQPLCHPSDQEQSTVSSQNCNYQYTSPQNSTQFVSPQDSTQFISPQNSNHQISSPQNTVQFISSENSTQFITPQNSNHQVTSQQNIKHQFVSLQNSNILSVSSQNCQPQFTSPQNSKPQFTSPQNTHHLSTSTPISSPQFTSSPFQISPPSLSTNIQYNELTSKSHSQSPTVTDSGFKVPPVPSKSLPVSRFQVHSTEALQSSPAPQSIVQHHHKMVIEDQIRKHVQLLAQTFLLLKTDTESSKATSAITDMLTDLNTRKSSGDYGSVMNVCNLDEALNAVRVGSELDGSNSKNAMEVVKMTIFDNPAFLYTHLLPRFEKMETKKRRSSNARSKFLPSEDNLVALGLEQFSDCKGAFTAEFIQQYLLRGKTVNEIYHRIKYLSSSKAGINHVKKFCKLGQSVQLDPIPVHTIDFRPPRLKSFCILPEWCQGLQCPQVSLRPVNIPQKEGYLPIQPRGGLCDTHSITPSVSSSSSSVISNKNSLVSKKTLSSAKSSLSRRKNQKAKSSQYSSPPSMSNEPADCVISPLRIDDSNIDYSQSPDLLKKAMNSCGIDGFPSPSSSSTPITADKAKSTTVKNLASAFEESETMILEQRQESNPENTGPSDSSAAVNQDQIQIGGDLTSEVVPDAPGDGGTVGIETSQSDYVSHCTGESSSHSPAISDIVNKTSDNSETIMNPSQSASVLVKTTKDSTCVSDRIDRESSICNETGNSKGASVKRRVVKVTLIKKGNSEPKKQNDLNNAVELQEKEKAENNITMGKHLMAENKLDHESAAGKVCDSVVEHAEGTPGENKDGSPNKLVPWISSIMSQIKTTEPQSGSNRMPVSESGDASQSSVKTIKSTSPGVQEANDPSVLYHKSSPIKIALIPTHTSPKRNLSIAPKSPCVKSVPYMPLPRVSPKRKELNRQVRHLIPKSFVFESKLPSPTKTTALNLKKKATLLCQKSPVKILPRPAHIPEDNQHVGMKTRGKSSVLTRSQRGISKPRRKEEAFCKKVRQAKRIEEDNESAKETESEASELEESGLSQEEDEDRTKLDDLMAASTTIRFGSKPTTSTDDDGKTKAEKKKAASLALLQPDLVQNDPKKDDRDTAFAQQYFNQVKETLSSDPDRFYKFLTLLKDLNKDHTNPVELYLDMVSLLSDHPQLVEDFAGFLLSFQAVECQCFSTNFQYAQIRQFLRQIEVQCGSSTYTYRKVLAALSTWSSMCQEGKLEGSLRDKMLGILKSVPGVLDNLISYFLDGAIPDCHAMDFEDINLDEDGEGMDQGDDDFEDINLDEDGEGMDQGDDDFEDVVLPDESDDYNTRTCTCQCHSSPTFDSYKKRFKHCASCSLQICEGRLVLKTSRYFTRHIKVIYPSEENKLAEEKEKLAQAKIEAAQMVLAKAKIQQQQKEQRKRKRTMEAKGPKPKRIRKKLEESKETSISDSHQESCKESGSEKADVKKKVNKVKTTKDSSAGNDIKATCEDKSDAGSKDNIKPSKGKNSKSKSKSDSLSIVQKDKDKVDKGRAVDNSKEKSESNPEGIKGNVTEQNLELDKTKCKIDKKSKSKTIQPKVIDKDKSTTVDKGKSKLLDKGKSKLANKGKSKLFNKGKSKLVDKEKSKLDKDDSKLLGKEKSKLDKDDSKLVDKEISKLDKDDSKRLGKEKSKLDKGDSKLDDKGGSEIVNMDKSKDGDKDKSKSNARASTKNRTDRKSSNKFEESLAHNQEESNIVDQSTEGSGKKRKQLQTKSISNNEKKSRGKNKVIKDNTPEKSKKRSRSQMKSQSQTPELNDSSKKVKPKKLKTSAQETNRNETQSHSSNSKDNKSERGKRSKQTKTIEPVKDEPQSEPAVGISGDCENIEKVSEANVNFKSDENSDAGDQYLCEQTNDQITEDENLEQGITNNLLPKISERGRNDEHQMVTLHSDKLCKKSFESKTVTQEGSSLETDGEAISEIFDRCILDRISDEGLTEAVLKSIQNQFPRKTLKMIEERGQQLLSLLESMSDQSSDVEEDD